MDIIAVFFFEDFLSRMKLESMVGPPTGMRPNEKLMNVFWKNVPRHQALDFMNAAYTIKGILAITVKQPTEVKLEMELVF